MKTKEPRSATSRDALRKQVRNAWWLWPAAVYLLTRIVNAAMIVIAGEHQLELHEYDGSHVADVPQAPPGYFRTATNWDGQWYAEIAYRGYPTTLPHDAAGDVTQSAWAFYPLYPLLSRAVMVASGLGFAHAAVLVSLTAGLVACLLIYRVVGLGQSRFASRVGVLGVCTFTASPAMQIAYTESLALLLLVATLAAIMTSRHGLAAGLLLLLGLTRPVTLPVALVIAAWGVILWRRGFRDVKSAAAHAALAIWAMACTFLWPLIVGVATGVPDAYRLTQRAWGNGILPPPVVFVLRHGEELGGAWIAVLVGVLIAGTVLGLSVLGANHVVLRTWALTYSAYILAVARWEVTSVRYFLLALPVFWPAVRPTNSALERRVHRVIIAVFAVAGLATQWLWIRYGLTFAADRRMFP